MKAHCDDSDDKFFFPPIENSTQMGFTLDCAQDFSLHPSSRWRLLPETCTHDITLLIPCKRCLRLRLVTSLPYLICCKSGSCFSGHPFVDLKFSDVLWKSIEDQSEVQQLLPWGNRFVWLKWSQAEILLFYLTMARKCWIAEANRDIWHNRHTEAHSTRKHIF